MKLIVHAPEERVVEAAAVGLMVRRDHPNNPLVGVKRGGTVYAVRQRPSATVTVNWQREEEAEF
jgi:hypothetical protein